MAPSYSERQAQYAAWRDRLRKPDEDIVLDDPKDNRWDPALLFQASDTIDLDATSIDLGADATTGVTDQRR
jgi:hypothetical protein